MSNRKLGPIARELIAAKKRIENPENWCPEGVGQLGEAGQRKCAIRALGGSMPAFWFLMDLTDDSIISVNARGHAAVMQMYDHAISKAAREGK